MQTICSAAVSYFVIVIFNDSCQTNYREVYQANFSQIFRFGRTVGDQLEISLKGRCHGNQFLQLRMRVAGRRRLVARRGGRSSRFALHV